VGCWSGWRRLESRSIRQPCRPGTGAGVTSVGRWSGFAKGEPHPPGAGARKSASCSRRRRASRHSGGSPGWPWCRPGGGDELAAAYAGRARRLSQCRTQIPRPPSPQHEHLRFWAGSPAKPMTGAQARTARLGTRAERSRRRRSSPISVVPAARPGGTVYSRRVRTWSRFPATTSRCRGARRCPGRGPRAPPPKRRRSDGGECDPCTWTSRSQEPLRPCRPSGCAAGGTVGPMRCR
jgi:hypothetical protein